MTPRHLVPLTTALLFACGPLDETEDTSSSVVGGARTYDRPEIGYTYNCTATLIRPNVAITAAHCWGYRSAEREGRYRRIRFDFGPNDSRNYNVIRYKSLGSSLGASDVTMLMLDTIIPSDEITPATLATEAPAAGTRAAIWGYGCTNQSRQVGGGVKRVVDISYGSSDNLCPGDSGGPATIGRDGPIWGINSSYGYRDGFGRPYQMIDRIHAQIDAWNQAYGVPGVDPADDMAPPAVELLEPTEHSVWQENTTVVVRARITDDLLLTRAELVWDFNGNTYPCPTNDRYVTCRKDGDEFEWSVLVGTGQRTFRVQGVDVAGNRTVSEDRRIELTADGLPPPDRTDFELPKIVIVSPQDGLRSDPQTTVEVVADITDDSALDEVNMYWAYNDTTYACPTNTQFVDCAVSGDRYTWTIRVGPEGRREFSITAVDAHGQVSHTGTRAFDIRRVQDVAAPQITILAPTPSSDLTENSEIEVVARVIDDVGVTSASLDWRWYNDQLYPCPHRSTYVDCDVVGDEYRWKVRVGTGERRFSIRARDGAGHETVTPEQSVFLRAP